MTTINTILLSTIGAGSLALLFPRQWLDLMRLYGRLRAHRPVRARVMVRREYVDTEGQSFTAWRTLRGGALLNWLIAITN